MCTSIDKDFYKKKEQKNQIVHQYLHKRVGKYSRVFLKCLEFTGSPGRYRSKIIFPKRRSNRFKDMEFDIIVQNLSKKKETKKERHNIYVNNCKSKIEFSHPVIRLLYQRYSSIPIITHFSVLYKRILSSTVYTSRIILHN